MGGPWYQRQWYLPAAPEDLILPEDLDFKVRHSQEYHLQ